MAKITIPCFRAKPTAAGVRYYWEPSATLKKAGWKPLPLGGDRTAAIAAAEARNADVAAWRTGGPAPRKIERFARRATLSALIKKYREEHFPALAPATRRVMDTHLNRLEAWAGDTPADAITGRNVDALAKAALKKVGHHPTFNLLKAGRTVFGWGKAPKRAYVQSNPFEKFELGEPGARKQVWEADDEGSFKAAAIDLGLPSLAFAVELAIYTAQRSSDLIGFTENALAPAHIFDVALTARFAHDDGQVWAWHLDQRKTKTPMIIPFDPPLLAKVRRAIAASRARARPEGRFIAHVLVDDRRGIPWTKREFIRAWNLVLEHTIRRTGRTHMADLQWRDFRRTRVVRLRRRGFNKLQIASLTGHSPSSIDKMLAVYGPIDPTMTAGVIAAAMDVDTVTMRKSA